MPEELQYPVFNENHWQGGDAYGDTEEERWGFEDNVTYTSFSVHCAARENDVRSLRQQIRNAQREAERGGSELATVLAERCYRGAAPLHYACAHGRADAVKVLLATGAVDPQVRWVNFFTEDSVTPIHMACMRGDADCVRALLRFPFSKAAGVCNGAVAFLCAARRGQTAFMEREREGVRFLPKDVRVLVGAFLHPAEKILAIATDPSDEVDETPLHCALTNGKKGDQAGVIRLLLEAKASLANAFFPDTPTEAEIKQSGTEATQDLLLPLLRSTPLLGSGL